RQDRLRPDLLVYGGVAEARVGERPVGGDIVARDGAALTGRKIGSRQLRRGLGLYRRMADGVPLRVDRHRRGALSEADEGAAQGEGLTGLTDGGFEDGLEVQLGPDLGADARDEALALQRLLELGGDRIHPVDGRGRAAPGAPEPAHERGE